LKRTLSDRSPEEPTPSLSGRHTRLVGVVVPPPPQPHSFYVQLGTRLRSSATVPSIVEEPIPPSSSSPSLASIDSGPPSDPHFEVSRLSLLLTASQEELRLRDAQYEERERQITLRHERERALYMARIKDLESKDRGEGGSGSRRG
jgi:hypothetical protein